MAITTFTGSMAASFAAGTTLYARPASNWPAHLRPPAPGTAPAGAATASAAMASSGVLSLTGLADSTEYYVSDTAGTKYVRITTFPERQEVMSNQADQANGYAKLDANGRVPSTDLTPSVVNVKDTLYGAKGNAIADDTAAIQAAIDAALVVANSTSGAIVFLPRGTYNVTTLRIGTNVTLKGSGGYATQIQQISGTAGYIIGPKVEGTSYLRATLEDLLITGFPNQTANLGGVYLRGFSDSRINRCQITYCRQFHIRLEGGSSDPTTGDAMHNKITNCTLGKLIAVTATGDTHSSTTVDGIAGTSAIRRGQSVTGNGIPLHTTVVTVGANSITLSQAATATASGVTLTFPAFAIQLSAGASGGAHPDRTIITHNYINSTNANTGVLRIDPATGELAPDGTRFAMNDIVGNPIWLDIQGGQSHRITDNTFENTGNGNTATVNLGPGESTSRTRDLGLRGNDWITHGVIGDLVWNDGTILTDAVWETGGWDSGSTQRETGRYGKLVPDLYREAEVCTLGGDIYRVTATSGNLPSGTIHGFKARARTSGTFTKIRCLVNGLGSSITDFRLAVGTSAWTLTTQTAESHASIASGYVTLDLLASVTVTAGDIITLWVGNIGATGITLRGATFGSAVFDILPTLMKQRAGVWTTGNAFPATTLNANIGLNVTPLIELVP